MPRVPESLLPIEITIWLKFSRAKACQIFGITSDVGFLRYRTRTRIETAGLPLERLLARPAYLDQNTRVAGL
jgi:hypothetical protein